MSFYKMERGWLDSDVWDKAPYTEREAWAWMIGAARWEDGKVAVLGNPVSIKRGQLSHSLRFLSDKFQWSVDKVRWFLKKLEKWEMCTIDNTTGQNVITICNYSKYQDSPNAQPHSEPQGYTTVTPQEPHKEEETKEIKEKNKRKTFSIEKPEDVTPQTWEDFLVLRKKKSAPVTATVLNGIRKEAAKAGCTLDHALATCCTRGWQSFQADWIQKPPNKGRTPMPSPAGG
jgi:hypothetical protein